MGKYIQIFDTTLRDGEQIPGISLRVREKLEIAEQLAKLKVDIIEAGFPIASPGDFEAVKVIAKGVKGPVIAGLARAEAEDIDRCWEAIKYSERPRIHTFISASNVQIKHQLRIPKEKVLEIAVAMVKRARKYTSDVEFSPMDATRAEIKFLYKMVEEAIKAGAKVINIPDTVGYAIPEEFGALIKGIKENVKGADKVIISVHCHNDLGLAVANSLVAVKNGAEQIECAVNGLGERAGNAALEETVMALETRFDQLGKKSRVNTHEITKTSHLVSLLTGYPVQPNKAIVGANAFAHESGIHQDGVLKERTTYEIMKPEDVGLVESRIVLGKHSGKHAFRSRLEKLGFFLKDDDLQKAFKRFKSLADRKKEITDRDLEALVGEQFRQISEIYRLESLKYSSGTEITPKATLKLSRAGVIFEEEAKGDGPVDASCKAIDKITGLTSNLIDFSIKSITGGLDAQGDVSMQLEIGGKRVSGRGVSTDIIEASAKAYLNAVNKIFTPE